jgi:hypothetical protein
MFPPVSVGTIGKISEEGKEGNKAYSPVAIEGQA